MPFSSKYRHTFGVIPKADLQYLDLKAPYTSGEGAYAAANCRYFGVSKAGGGGPVYVHPHNNPGRVKYKTVNVHKGKALDFQFHPFVENILGVASEDASASITLFPEEMKENVTEATVVMKGHMKKVHLMKFAPSANNVMATASWDKTVKLWNVTTGECTNTFEGHSGVAFSMDWNKDSSLLAMTSKAKAMLAFDPRQTKSAWEMEECMEGTKSSKVFWFNKNGWIGATGFTKQAKRQLKIWDLKKMDKPLYSAVVDQQSSVLMPYMDEDTNMLYLFGKGDGTVTFSELVNDSRCVYGLGAYRDTDPQKGGAFVPKRGLDTSACEVARFMKLTKSSVLPVSFTVPRKTGKEIFQADLYPDTDSGLPAVSADEYFSGKNGENATMSMDPSTRDAGAKKVEFTKAKPYGELVSENLALTTENEELKKRIETLEAELKALKESSG